MAKLPKHTSRTQIVKDDEDDSILLDNGNGEGDGDEPDDTPDENVDETDGPSDDHLRPPPQPEPTQGEANQAKTDVAGEAVVEEATDDKPQATDDKPFPSQADLDAIREGTYQAR